MKKRIHFIVNPFSGTSRKNNLDSLLASHLDHSLYEYEIKHTQAPGHATELAKSAVDSGVDVVVAVGGDGSVNEVSQALLHTESVLGILPGGSGNGFAMHMGYGRNIKQAIQILNTGKPKVIDTCRVNDRYFINVAGVGFDSRIAYMTKKNSKRGFWPYFKTTLKESQNFRPITLRISIDGQVIEGKYAMAAVANATMFGYYFTIAPGARLDDGLLDLVLIKEAPIYKYALSSFRFLNKTLDKSSVTDFYQGREIAISLLEDDYSHVDGEGMIAEKEMKYTVTPKSLRVLAPISNF